MKKFILWSFLLVGLRAQDVVANFDPGSFVAVTLVSGAVVAYVPGNTVVRIAPHPLAEYTIVDYDLATSGAAWNVSQPMPGSGTGSGVMYHVEPGGLINTDGYYANANGALANTYTLGEGNLIGLGIAILLICGLTLARLCAT